MFKKVVNAVLILGIALLIDNGMSDFRIKPVFSDVTEEEIKEEKVKEDSLSIQEEEKIIPNIEQMVSICELATQECYYHNVAKYYEEDSSGWWLWKKNKHFWIEYSGTVNVGVDISKMQIIIEKNVIKIYLPDATILSSKLTTESLSEDAIYVDDKSAKITPEDTTKLYETSEKDIISDLSENSNILTEAKDKAKTLISNYINNINNMTNSNYTIEWTDSIVVEQPQPKVYKKVLGYKTINLNKDLKVVQPDYEWGKPLEKRNTTQEIVVHHSGGSNASVADIHKWHQEEGIQTGIGYHYLVKKDGTIYVGRPDDTIGAHAKGANSISVGICFEGNFEENITMPEAQKAAGQKLIKYLKNKYNVSLVKRHSEETATVCPGKNFPFDELK